MAWSVVQELSVVELELAHLEGHVVDGGVLIIVQNPQEALHGLHGSWEVEVEAHLDEDCSL